MNPREIENHLCQEDVLIAYARHDQPDDLFGRAEAARREQVMRECIAEVTAALAILSWPGPWSNGIKASDEFLNPVFERFFNKLGLPNLLRKTDCHVLAGLVPKEAGLGRDHGLAPWTAAAKPDGRRSCLFRRR